MQNLQTKQISSLLNTPIEITNNINIFHGYDKELAKCHIINYGCIYYYVHTKEPLEIEDLENVLDDLQK